MKPFLLFLFCICLLSCNYFKSKPDHISPDKMAKVLVDLQMAEMYSTMVGRDSTTHKNQEKNLDSLAHYYNEILAHYSISMEELNKSLAWYRANPEMLDTVYTNMIPQLTALQGNPQPTNSVQRTDNSVQEITNRFRHADSIQKVVNKALDKKR